MQRFGSYRRKKRTLPCASLNRRGWTHSGSRARRRIDSFR
jgi:hypothetical protein